MKQKKWKHCPACGTKDSMAFKKTLKQTIHLKEYPPLTISNLEGYECHKCKEAILNIQTCRQVDRLMGEHKAKVDSKRVVAAELTEVAALTKTLGVSRQRIHQMMIAGKIPYVFIDQVRVPIKTAA